MLHPFDSGGARVGVKGVLAAAGRSDLDLAIITNQPLPLAVGAALAEAFSESDLPYKVDIVDWAALSEPFRRIIERHKVVVQEGRRRFGAALEEG